MFKQVEIGMQVTLQSMFRTIMMLNLGSVFCLFCSSRQYRPTDRNSIGIKEEIFEICKFCSNYMRANEELNATKLSVKLNIISS